jgi:hypothetical protein
MRAEVMSMIQCCQPDSCAARFTVAAGEWAVRIFWFQKTARIAGRGGDDQIAASISPLGEHATGVEK